MASQAAEAEPLFKEGLELYERLDAVSDPNYATLLNNYGLAARDQQDFSAAIQRYSRSIRSRLASAAPDQSELATTYNNLGDAKAALHDRADAIEAFSKTIALGGAASASVRIYALEQIAVIDSGLAKSTTLHAHTLSRLTIYSLSHRPTMDALRLRTPDLRRVSSFKSCTKRPYSTQTRPSMH